jgi:hypothetical protein
MRPVVATVALWAGALAGTAAYAAPAPAPASAGAPTASAGASAGASAAPTITRSAHVAFENCNAQHITLSVTAPTHAFAPTQPVSVTVRLRNTGSATCGAALAQHIPEAHHTLSVGPCGTLPLTVSTEGKSGTAVYPGTQIFFCPQMSGFRLGPHSTVQAKGSWPQVAYVGSGPSPKAEQAAAGTYRLTVDRVVTVPITLTSG